MPEAAVGLDAEPGNQGLHPFSTKGMDGQSALERLREAVRTEAPMKRPKLLDLLSAFPGENGTNWQHLSCVVPATGGYILVAPQHLILLLETSYGQEFR
jgi:hypothetical protein